MDEGLAYRWRIEREMWPDIDIPEDADIPGIQVYLTLIIKS
jgi:hypothetical protein